MVPGALGSIIPSLKASPLRGRTWASKPSGKPIWRPVGTSFRSPGCIGRGSLTAAKRSRPLDPSVMYLGRSSPSWCGRQQMRTSQACISLAFGTFSGMASSGSLGTVSSAIRIASASSLSNDGRSFAIFGLNNTEVHFTLTINRDDLDRYDIA